MSHAATHRVVSHPNTPHSTEYNLQSFYQANITQVTRAMEVSYPELDQEKLEKRATHHIINAFHKAASEVESRNWKFALAFGAANAAIYTYAAVEHSLSVAIWAVGLSIAIGVGIKKDTDCNRHTQKQMDENGTGFFDKNAIGCSMKYARAQRSIDRFISKAALVAAP